MKKYNELYGKILNYVKDEFGSDSNILMPIFKRKNQDYYLCFIMLDNKIPSKLIYVDINTFEIEETSEMNVHIPLGRNKTSLFDYSNYILKEFNAFKENTLNEIKNKKEYSHPDEEVLLIDGELKSPSDYLLEVFDDIFSVFKEDLSIKIESNIKEGHENYHRYLFNRIIDTYKEVGRVDRLENLEYLNYIKYTYPEYERLLDNINNI